METKKVCVIKGDGIGVEVINEGLKIINLLCPNINIIQAEAGYRTWQKFGTPLPHETIDKVSKSDCVLFGAVTTPPNIPDYFSPIVRLRNEFQLYANIRPCKTIPAINKYSAKIDICIFRENTECLYGSPEEGDDSRATTLRIITRKASEKIIKAAFEYANKKGKKIVTLVHKANVMRKTDGLFLSVGKEIAKQYPQIKFEDQLVDSFCYNLVCEPEKYQIIVTTNMFGDIISDIAAAFSGGMGCVASANMGEQLALFEPVHGSAPDISGLGIANPLATFFAIVMMLDYLGFKKESILLYDACINILNQGYMTKDLAGTCSTTEFTNLIIKTLKNEIQL